MNPIEATIKELGYADNPSARRILRSKLESFQRAPNASKGQELEEYGVSVDYSSQDAGEAPQGAR